MDSYRSFQFFSKNRRDPYIQEVFDYTINDQTGVIHFDGYYYVENEEFPRRTFYVTQLVESEPYQSEVNEQGLVVNSYKTLEEKFYEIEIFDRVKLKNTNEYDEVEEEDGHKMRICYFPTDEQKIYFKVIQEFQKVDDMFKRIGEFTEEQAK
jgi:hypothetical protein